jgi:hypothetical protein
MARQVPHAQDHDRPEAEGQHRLVDQEGPVDGRREHQQHRVVKARYAAAPAASTSPRTEPRSAETPPMANAGTATTRITRAVPLADPFMTGGPAEQVRDQQRQQRAEHGGQRQPAQQSTMDPGDAAVVRSSEQHSLLLEGPWGIRPLPSRTRHDDLGRAGREPKDGARGPPEVVRPGTVRRPDEHQAIGTFEAQTRADEATSWVTVTRTGTCGNDSRHGASASSTICVWRSRHSPSSVCPATMSS